MSIVRGVFNRILHIIVRFSPGATSIRPFLHKLRGVKIYGKVFIGDDVYIENEHPECVEINDEAQIVLRTIIMAHFRGAGKIIIGKKVWVGAGCIIAASTGQTLTIGEGSVLAAGAVVTKDVPPWSVAAGNPARVVRQLPKSEYK